MTKPNDRLAHAMHNEDVCNHLSLKEEFADWTITTAFYSALHFVSHKIFPFKVKAIEGKMTDIETLDQYYSYSKSLKKSISKHELLLELVGEKLTEETYNYYDWLYSSANTARYHHYQHPPEISNRAITYMNKIKKACS